MIVFGLLDAHTSFYSSLTGGIRLDNYVYTVESFEQALALLKPNGLLALSFYVEQPWIATRMGQMMRDAQGSDAMVSRIASNTYTFLAGPGAPLQGPTLSRGIPSAFAQEFPAGPRSTDDWPFIYLRGKAIPPMLIAASVAIALVTALVVFFFFRGETRFNRHFFFLGAGFLLLETRTIAQLALLFGTTWRVSAIAIAAILAMILLANLIVLRRGGFALAPLYGVLALALLVNFFAPASSAVGQGVAAAIGMTVLLAVPLFLAALIFASSISKENGIVPVLAANLVGAVLGGLLENTSLIFGISALNFVALALYLLSMRRLGRAV